MLENIEVPLPLGDFKALRASWVVKVHDFLMIERAHEIIKNGWNLPALDPFQEIDPIESNVCFEEHQRYLRADQEYENVSLRGIA